MLSATGVWNYVLLDRTPDWYPALRWIVLIGSILIAAVLIVGAHQLGRLTVIVAAAGLLFGIAGSAAYTIDTVATVHTGSIPTSGPSSGDGFGGGGRWPGRGAGSGNGTPATRSAPTGTPPGATVSGSTTPGTASGTTASGSTASGATSNTATATTGTPGGQGGPGEGTDNNTALRALLKSSSNYRWAAAAIGSQSAGSLELSTGASVMPIGGFTGSDPSPTLAQFERYVADGDIHYFVAGGQRRPRR